MKKSLIDKITIFLYIILGASTVPVFFIIYKNIDSPFAFRFIVGYLLFLVLLVIYSIIITIMRMRRLKRVEIRKRLRNFVLWLVSFGAVGYITRLVLNRPSKGLLGDLAVPLGLAMGIAFLDLIFTDDKGK